MRRPAQSLTSTGARVAGCLRSLAVHGQWGFKAEVAEAQAATRQVADHVTGAEVTGTQAATSKVADHIAGAQVAVAQVATSEVADHITGAKLSVQYPALHCK